MRRDVLIAVGLFAAMFMIFNAPGAALHGAGQKGSISSKGPGAESQQAGF
jgi:hypothetical protein